MKQICFLLIVFLMIGCQKDELPIVQNDLSKNAKSWYEKNHDEKFNQNLNFYGEPDWENYFQVEDDTYFPLVYEYLPENIQKKVNSNGSEVYLKSFLKFSDKGKGLIEESLKVFVSYDKKDFDNIDTVLKLPSATYNYYTELENNQLLTENIANSKNGGCETYYIIIHNVYDDGSVESFTAGHFEICGGGGGIGGGGGTGGGGGGIGGGGGTGGNGGMTIEEVAEILESLDEARPPSCESFTFTRPTVASPFQNAYISGVRFLALTNSNSNPIFIAYPSPIQFNAPVVDRFGNVYTNGVLAEASAKALKFAMDQTWQRYKNDPSANEMSARIFFEEKLIESYPDYIPGGRVTMRPTVILGPIELYKTTFFGTGNCD